MGFFFRVAIWATCLSTSLLAAPLESPSESPLYTTTTTTTNKLATRDMPTHSIQILSLKDDKTKNIQFSVFSGPYGAGVDPCNPGSKGFKHIGNYDSGIHWAGEAYPSYFELGFMYLPFEANWPFPKEDVLFPVDSDCAIKGPKERELAAPHAFSAEDALLKGWAGQPSPAQLRCGNNLIYDFELESMWNEFDIVCDGGTGRGPRFRRTWVVEY